MIIRPDKLKFEVRLQKICTLQYMAQIKEKQAEQEAGDWERLSATQRQETENEFHHLSMLARFHNIMGVETIQCLELLTKEIKSIFCHPMIVDRMAAMLNYFLLHLVSAAIWWWFIRLQCCHLLKSLAMVSVVFCVT